MALIPVPTPRTSPLPSPSTPSFRNIQKVRHGVETTVHWATTHQVVTLLIVVVLSLLYTTLMPASKSGKKSGKGTKRPERVREYPSWWPKWWPGRKQAAQRNATVKLARLLGWETAERFVKWARKPDRPGAKIVLRYAAHVHPDDKIVGKCGAILQSLVGGDWECTNNALHNRLVFVRLGAPVQLPDMVSYSDKVSPSAAVVPFAQDVDTHWVTTDLTGLTPHVLFSGTTGWAKTTTLSVFVAHMAARGCLIDICDPKRAGFTTAFGGLPNIRVHTEIGDMVTAVHRFRREMEDVYRTTPDGDLVAGLPPQRVLVLDESGSFCLMAEDAEATPEVFREIKQILWKGRAAGFHLLVACHQANVKALFGASDPRDQFGLRIAAGPQSSESWGFMYGRSTPIMKTEAVKGRAVAGIGTQMQVVQLAHITPERARMIASRGSSRFGDTSHTPVDVSHTEVDTSTEDSWEPSEPHTPHTESHTPHTERPVLTLVKSPARAVDENPEPEAERPGVLLKCIHCGHEWRTRAKPRVVVRCQQCQRAKKVPVPKV